MPIWPFRRKSSRKKSRSGTNGLQAGPNMRTTGLGKYGASPNGTDLGPIGADQTNNAKGNRLRRGSREQRKLHRDPERRTYSFSPGRNDTIRVPKDIHRQHPVPPLPNSVDAVPEPTQPAIVEQEDHLQQGSEQEWQRVPTLHRKSAKDLAHRKSSKKRKDADRDREAELKAMSSHMPPATRAATLPDLPGAPSRRETKRLRGMKRIFTNPASEVSLPIQESIHSSISSGSEKFTSYELKGMDVLAPRPTIRYFESPRYVHVPLASGFISDGSEGKRKRISERMALPEEELKTRKRIEELADDLDAGDLRELMERDQRRREKKKIADQLKMERRLARRAEKQRAAEAEAKRNGTPPPKNMDRGILGRELGLGIDTNITTSEPADGNDVSPKTEARPVEDQVGDSSAVVPDVLDEFQKTTSLPPTEAGSPAEEREDPVVGIAQVARLSRASMSPPSSPTAHNEGRSSISQMISLNKLTSATPGPPSQPEPSRRYSDTSVRQPQSWTSFFKRSSKSKRESVPSSFSNTSRDSMPVPQPLPTSYAPPRSSTGGPKRTMSKFREDLPELPLSPPDSRVQSPEADIPSPIRNTARGGKRFIGRRQPAKISAKPENVRHDTPTSGYRSLEPNSRLQNETPTSGQRSTDVESPEPLVLMSQSLASVDSEGSWLSGRPRASSKRTSMQPALHPLRDSISSTRQQYKDNTDSAEEELGIAEDEYFSRLTPGAEESYGKAQKHRRASGNPMPSSDEEDGGSLGSPSGSHRSKWGAVGRQATVVHGNTRAKSREGLLNEYDDESDENESPREIHRVEIKDDDLENNEEQSIQRATSIDLGKGHVRHISAGSARLLELKPRASGESKRVSSG